jgi:hypothetical protein
VSPYFKHQKVGFFSIFISQFIDLECDVNTVEILNVYEEAYGEIDTELPTVEANSDESEPGQNLHSWS